MDREEIEKKVKEILIDKLDINAEDIKLNSLLADELGIDSFEAIELAYALEDEFEIRVSDDEMLKLETVEDIIKAIEKKYHDKGYINK